MKTPPNHYELLGIDMSADTATLRKAFHKLSKTLHPDTTTLPLDEAASRFCAVRDAYELLLDPAQRELYDKALLKQSEENKYPAYEFEAITSKFITSSYSKKGCMRPLSGGELFALLLLGISLLLCLTLSLFIAFVHGKSLQIQPSWLSLQLPSLLQNRVIYNYDYIATSSNTLESTFDSCT